MFARVTHLHGAPERVDEATRNVKEIVIPAAHKLAGFKGGIWAGDRKTGKAFGLTLWESEEAMRASEEAADRLRQDAARQASGNITGVDRYEVFEHVGEVASDSDATGKFARVTTIHGQPGGGEEGMRYIKEKVVPMLGQLPGFLGGLWTIDRASGKGFSIAVYESERHVKESEEAAARLRAGFPSAGGSGPTAEIMEVTATAGERAKATA